MLGVWFCVWVHDMFYVLRLYVCLVISTWMCYKNILENILSLKCVNWKDKIKRNKIFRNLFGLMDNEIKF